MLEILGELKNLSRYDYFDLKISPEDFYLAHPLPPFASDRSCETPVPRFLILQKSDVDSCVGHYKAR